jgi:hypothetical protein
MGFNLNTEPPDQEEALLDLNEPRQTEEPSKSMVPY